jgi:hypothetical protein
MMDPPPTTSHQYAFDAQKGRLTLAIIHPATKEELEQDFYFENTVLLSAAWFGQVEIVNALLDKGLNIDGLSGVCGNSTRR